MIKKTKLLLTLVLTLGSIETSSLNAQSRVLESQTARYKGQGNNMTKEILEVNIDSFYDQNFDYSYFSGRVTDRDETTSIIKITSDNKNVKFFRAGDQVSFRVHQSKGEDLCSGNVRSVEPDYFVLYVQNLHPCFPKNEYFRRGTALVMNSLKLSERVREASIYRATLLNKKKDFMRQLNTLNNGIWNFEERKVKLAAEYDRKIAEMEKEKIKALDDLISRKNDEMKLQRELAYRLDNIDFEIDFYRIEKVESMLDRWHLDHDQGLPVYDRPETPRAKIKKNEIY